MSAQVVKCQMSTEKRETLYVELYGVEVVLASLSASVVVILLGLHKVLQLDAQAILKGNTNSKCTSSMLVQFKGGKRTNSFRVSLKILTASVCL